MTKSKTGRRPTIDRSILNTEELRVLITPSVKAAVDFEADSRGISTSSLVRDLVVRELESYHAQ